MALYWAHAAEVQSGTVFIFSPLAHGTLEASGRRVAWAARLGRPIEGMLELAIAPLHQHPLQSLLVTVVRAGKEELPKAATSVVALGDLVVHARRVATSLEVGAGLRRLVSEAIIGKCESALSRRCVSLGLFR